MHKGHTYRTRILTGVAGSALAGGVLFASLLSGPASAEPAAPDYENLPSCLALVNPDGTDSGLEAEACLPVDPFNDPNMTLEQRLAFLNPESPIYDEMVQEIKDRYGK